ncbi:MAG: class I SAM-dependent methyltransferase [Bacteroidota bacterium]
MSKISILKRYISYYFEAQHYRKIQLPAASTFGAEVLEDRRDFYAFDEVEALRDLLLKDKNTIQVTDFGAGSRIHKTNERQIRKIAQHSITRPAFCAILFRIINFYKPKTILELGTSLGIATLYQSFAALNSQIITIEGCPNIAARAQQHFHLLNAQNITSIVGRFEEQLPKVLAQLPQLDFAFFDGNHQQAATLQYFEYCLKKAHTKTIFVFDDIHWSTDMEAAWEAIKKHPRVSYSIDLFFFGIVFFEPQQIRNQHLVMIPSRWKPF